MSPTTELNEKTPYELWWTAPQTNQSSSHKQTIFMGYSSKSKGYRISCQTSKRSLCPETWGFQKMLWFTQRPSMQIFSTKFRCCNRPCRQPQRGQQASRSQQCRCDAYRPEQEAVGDGKVSTHQVEADRRGPGRPRIKRTRKARRLAKT